MTGAASLRRRAGPRGGRGATQGTVGARALSDRTWSSGSLQIERSGRGGARLSHRAQDASPHLQLLVVHEGSVSWRQRAVAAEAGPGHLVSLFRSEPFALVLATGSRVTSLLLSRADLDERGVETSRFAGLAWEGDSLLSALNGVLGAIATASQTLPGVPYLERAILELVTGILSAHQEVLALGASPEEHQRQRIINLIKVSGTDPQVDVAWIAAQLGMSRRYAHRLFEGTDTSIASLLRSRRVAYVEALLRTGPPDLPIARVAASSGFRSADTCARAFRMQFGVAPAEYRARLYDR